MALSMSMLSNGKHLQRNLWCCGRVLLQCAYSSDEQVTGDKKLSPRMEEFQKKLRAKTPIGKLDEIEGKHPYEEKEPLAAWPDNTNPNTGEVGGPKGPEPTRYGDWERKGRCVDF